MALNGLFGYPKFSKLGVPKEILSKDILDIFQNENYQMIIINSKYEMATDELNEQVTKVNEIIKKYDENAIKEYDNLIKVAKDLNLNLNNIDKRGYPYHIIYND